MRNRFFGNRWKIKTRDTFARACAWFASFSKEPRKLWVVFSLRLSLALFLATTIPILVLFLLSKWGFIEASQELDFQEPMDLDSVAVDIVPTPEADMMGRIYPGSSETAPDGYNDFVPLRGVLVEPPVDFDPETGTWRINTENARFVFSSNIFRFRVEVPAWIAIGSLPLVSLMIGVVLSSWMSRGITRPFSRLADAAHAIGRHDLGSRVQTEGSQELRDLAQSFNRMAEQLEHAEKVRRNLMTDVAHELRTPLTVLDGNLRAMLDGVHPLNEAEIALLYEQTHHLNRLVDDLLELSLAEAERLSLDRREVDLARLVKETVAHFDLLAQEQGIQLTAELDEPLVHPCLDGNRVRQVLHNLLSNAFRYTPGGGTVTVSARRSADGNAVQITVTDTGVGISAEELPHIFERFYHTEEMASRDRGGTGLGLAIVRAIVDAHGGIVSAQSDGRGKGSTFTLRLLFE